MKNLCFVSLSFKNKKEDFCLSILKLSLLKRLEGNINKVNKSFMIQFTPMISIMLRWFHN